MILNIYIQKMKIHGKEKDDNIIKKLTSSYLESIRNWLNKSFVDEKLNFLNEKMNKKRKQFYFFKLDPKIINNQIKKEIRLEILNNKFKDIFFSYPISLRFQKISKNCNKDLIEQIYNEDNQPFVIYILGLTYYDGLNYYNGQITNEGVIEYFKNNYNYDEEIIKKFINNFEKLDKFFDKIIIKNKGKNDEDSLKNYFSKIKILSLNYKESFEWKKERKENKENKKNKIDVSDNDLINKF